MLQRLGKGAQGSVFLVEDKETGQKLVLKKVALNTSSNRSTCIQECILLMYCIVLFACLYYNGSLGKNN